MFPNNVIMFLNSSIICVPETFEYHEIQRNQVPKFGQCFFFKFLYLDYILGVHYMSFIQFIENMRLEKKIQI